MEPLFKEYLFDRNLLVADGGEASGPEHAFPVLYALAALFGIRIVSGSAYAEESMIPFVSERIGTEVPAPFYRDFPETVKSLSEDALLYDQLYHYTLTYGLGAFEEPGHSVFEPLFARTAFKEQIGLKNFSIITEEEAGARILEMAANLLAGSRPLNERQYEVVLACIRAYRPEIARIGSKNTAVRLLADTRDLGLLRFFRMPDVMKLAGELQYRACGSEDLKKLNLKNRDRVFLIAVIDRLAEEGRTDLPECCEKKALWQGLLHHIHYKPREAHAAAFVSCIRGKRNLSVYSAFERAMAERDIPEAVRILREGKGSAAVLRSLDYIASRCASPEDAAAVLDAVDSDNVIVLVQMLIRYADYREERVPRDFRFTLHNRMKIHRETEEETGKRKSLVPEALAGRLAGRVEENLRKVLSGRLGKVYIDPAMKKIALPIQENTSQGGYGVLPRGSRIPIGSGKKVRAFTYWEKVNDIDLSVIGLSEDGKQTEFSWRTMFGNQSAAITFSGDQTSGFHGGSEYFDVDTELFRAQYPGIRYLVFCDNVFSRSPFSSCFCRAGYMLRDTEDSGEVFEPKTVRSAYLIDCDSTFAYLFALDLQASEFIWLNTARAGQAIVAGETSLGFLTKYFGVTSVINLYSFFGMMASELVECPEDAEIVVSDRDAELPGETGLSAGETAAEAPGSGKDGTETTAEAGPCREYIRSWDYDRILALMNP